MSRERKTVDGWEIQSDYGQGWECECFEWTRTDAKQRLKEYRANSPYPVRSVKRRVKKSTLSDADLRDIARAVERQETAWQEKRRQRLAEARKVARPYVVTVKHDRGTVRIVVTASRLTAAVRQVMAAERCPFRAVKKVEVVK